MRLVSDESLGSPQEQVDQVMVVDADADNSHALVRGLATYGLRSTPCPPGDVVARMTESRPTALVLGRHLTPLQTWDLCREAHACSGVPIIALVGLDGPDYVAMALDAGADMAFTAVEDVPPRLVVSAVRAAQRRERYARRLGMSVVEAGPLRIDLVRKTVDIDGESVPLTVTEFGILAVLAQNPGRVISAVEIVRQVHGYEAPDSEAQDIVKVHISRLRQKLDSDPDRAGGIANVRGQGYMYMFERRSGPRASQHPARLPEDEGTACTTGADR